MGLSLVLGCVPDITCNLVQIFSEVAFHSWILNFWVLGLHFRPVRCIQILLT